MKTLTKLALSAVFAISLPVMSMDLQQAMSALGAAKTQGLVGEQPNGYLGVVGSSAQAKEIAELINKARKAEYQKLAAKNGIQLADVEAIAGKKAIEKTDPGQFIYLNGQWQKK
ncbi:YdbL family protein [Rheinheimera mangrovi]|uniref:YdbL family protein n=1 Tax=Rheinheimera mangrovi TaxID=2498451 RepID=UPI000F8EC487|nr:YdbL family protein [Rheinheimera mangrovi]